jgi:hypothetical protein
MEDGLNVFHGDDPARVASSSWGIGRRLCDKEHTVESYCPNHPEHQFGVALERYLWVDVRGNQHHVDAGDLRCLFHVLVEVVLGKMERFWVFGVGTFE